MADLLRACRTALESGAILDLDLGTVESAWPNGCVPAAAAIQQYKEIGLEINVNSESSRIKSTSLRNPIQATRENLASRRLMNTVWVYFDETEASSLTNALVAEMQKTVELEDGVLEALNFCLYEILDNVFQHSRSNSGFLMATLTGRATRLALAIADTGIGVYNSFQGSEYNPPSHFDALTPAIQAGVTSTGDKRGNGLFALSGTAEKNRGRLVLHSGFGELSVIGDRVTGRDRRGMPTIGPEHYGLFIDWQLDLKQPVSLADILGMPPVNHQLEALETPSGQYAVRIADHETGTGSRKAAEQLRLYLLNLLHQGAGSLVLDFDGVIVVSASFADEVIGKLAEQFGPIGFWRKFQLVNMTTTIESLLDRAIRLRVSIEPPVPIERGTRSLN